MKLYPSHYHDPDEGRAASPQDAVMSEINTTPLVDVMLVLLIIFLITIPAVSASVQVRLPRENTQAQTPAPDAVVISVEQSGAVYWNREGPVEGATLAAALQTLAATEPQPPVYVRGDSALSYAAVGQVMAAAQAAGLARVGLLTEPESAR